LILKMIKKPGTGGFFVLKNFQKMRKTEGSLISKLKKNPELKVMFINSLNTCFNSLFFYDHIMLGKPNEDSFVESL
jgi:hypothetical protein